MPFDAASSQIFALSDSTPTEPVDALLAAGFVPISTATIDLHKRTKEAEHRRSRPLTGAGIISITDVPDWLVTNSMTKAGFRPHWQAATETYDRATKDISAIPRNLFNLARRAGKVVENPTYAVEYFGDDPILHMAYGPKGGRRSVPLGVWENRQTLHIAKQPWTWDQLWSR